MCAVTDPLANTLTTKTIWFLCVRGDRPQYVDVAEIRENPWSNRALSALLICMTEGLVEEKAGKYVLTEMGRLYFSNPKSKKK